MPQKHIKNSMSEDSVLTHGATGKDDVDIFYTIRVLRPLLIILICIVHLPYIDGYLSSLASTGNLTSLFVPFLKDTFARGAAPLLSLFSGYLAFFSYQNGSYFTFTASKTKRLLLPFLFWNFLLGIIFFVSHQKLGYPPAGKLLNGASLGLLLDQTIGIQQFPINGPLYFLRDLFVISLIIPLFKVVARQHVLAFILLILLSMLFTYAPSIKIGDAFILFRSDLIFFFFLGYCLGLYKLPEEMVRKSPLHLPAASAIFVALCVASTFFLVRTKIDIQEYAKIKPIFGVLFLALMPGIVNYISTHKDSFVIRWLAKISPYSFTLFLVHYPIAVLVGYIVRTNSITINNASSLATQITLIFAYLGVAGMVSLVLAKAYWEVKKLIPKQSTKIQNTLED